MLQSIEKILASKSLPLPDGRPLYAYDVTDDDYRTTEQDLRAHVARYAALHHEGAAAFCLYGAEYFGRGDGSDWVTYDGVTRALGRELPQQDLREAIAAGMRFWRRRVLTGSRGGEYLATLVCEGGLPLRLLQTEGSRLRRFFTELLGQHETYPTLDLDELAAELASVLPIRMQNPVVYALASALIRHVAVLRNPAATPGQLAACPVPLRLDSEIARDLLAGLRHAPAIRATSEPGIVVRTKIDLVTQPILRRQLVLPRKLSRAWLQEAVPGLPELPPRWYVALLTAAGTRWTVGVATASDDGYALQSFSARDVARVDAVTQQLQCVITFDERDLGAFVPRGGEALGSAAWTFSDEADDAVLRATGSYRSRADTLLLALPRDARLDLDAGATVEAVGELLGLDRSLVRFRGSARVIQPGDTVTVATGQAVGDEPVFELRGSRVSPPVRNADLWLGRPHVVERDAQGFVRNIPQDALQWRRRGGTWSSDATQALGDCELRVSRDGYELRTRARILPRDFTLRLECGKDRRGTIEVRSAQLSAVGVTEPGSSFATTKAARGGFDVEVVAPASGSQLPAAMEVKLKLINGSELPLTTPFPVEQRTFTGRNGEPLSGDELCSIDDLSHIRAVALSPENNKMWDIVLRMGPARITLARLPQLGGGLHEIPLETLRPAILAALAAGSSLDSEVQLRLENAAHVGGPAPGLRIRRYGATLTPATTGEVHDIVVDPNAAARLGEAVVESLRAQALRLAEPDRTPVLLSRVSRGRWNVDAGLEPGFWLLMAYQNDYLRTRPLRIAVPGPAPAPDDDPVSQAMSVRNPGERAMALEDAVSSLGTDTTRPGWATLRKLVSTVGTLPAGTFDALRSVTRCPRVAVSCLLDAGPRAKAIWSGLEDLPFLWVTVPFRAWLDAIQGWVAMLRRLLPQMARAEFEHTLETAAPILFGPGKPARFLWCVHDAAYMLMEDVPEPKERWVFPLCNAPVRAWAANPSESAAPLGAERNQLLVRHTNEYWPEDSPFADTHLAPALNALAAACVAGVPRHKATVLTTPVLLAQRSLEDSVNCDLLLLRRIRDFDPDWFDFAFAQALSILLGARHERKEAPFNE